MSIGLMALNVTKATIESKAFSLESIRAQYLLAVTQAYYDILSKRLGEFPTHGHRVR